MKKSILITGASQGIGLASACALESAGWEVIGVARRAPADFPGEFIECDLSSHDNLAELVTAIKQRSTILGIVNNLGMARHESFANLDYADFESLLAFNLRPALLLSQAVLGNMKNANFGRIINIGSLVTQGYPFRTSYAAAKSALVSLTKTIAIEYATNGITANVIAPGPTETELFRQNNPAGSEAENRYLSKIPMQRLAKPQEIASAVAFFASAEAGFITGQTVFIDGGASLS